MIYQITVLLVNITMCNWSSWIVVSAEEETWIHDHLITCSMPTATVPVNGSDVSTSSDKTQDNWSWLPDSAEEIKSDQDSHNVCHSHNHSACPRDFCYLQLYHIPLNNVTTRYLRQICLQMYLCMLEIINTYIMPMRYCTVLYCTYEGWSISNEKNI